jgi:RNA polymerase sigma-70 factor (ECF subfamily)
MSLIPAACCDAIGTSEDSRIAGDAGPAGPAGWPGAPRTAAEVFAGFGARIHRLARRMLGHEADAEDVAQDVLLLVVRKLDTFRGDSSFATWIDRVTVNAALLHRRKKVLRRERAGVSAFWVAGAAHASPTLREPAGPDEQAQSHEARQLIEAAVARLPRLYREAYVMSEMEELSNAEIGSRLGLSLSAVKSRVHRARLLLRRALAPHFEPAEPGLAS